MRALAAVPAIEEAIVTIPPGMESRTRAEVRAAALEIPVKLTPGGAERQDSVRIALALTSAEAELVVVHDAARPFATPAMFATALATAARVGGAIAAIPLADTLKRVADPDGSADSCNHLDQLNPNLDHRPSAHRDEDYRRSDDHSREDYRRGDDYRVILATVARSSLWQAQTPQAFRRALLRSEHMSVQLQNELLRPMTLTWSSSLERPSRWSMGQRSISKSRPSQTCASPNSPPKQRTGAHDPCVS